MTTVTDATGGFQFDDVGTLDTHTVSIDWGDGSPIEMGASSDRTFDATHTYADNGDYTIAVTVNDDDGGELTGAVVATVLNVAPTLVVAENATVDEGALLTIVDIGTFTDPGFDNPAGAPPTVETFEYRIDWGDGSPVDIGAATVDTPGGVGMPTAGSFDGSHIYADNGDFTVTVTVLDDDGGSDTQALLVTVVDNVQPQLTVVDNQRVDEGTLLSIVDIGTFTDPGFDNPQGSPPSVETFIYTIDWGDGSSVDTGTATIDRPGEMGVPTEGSFDGSHTYADDGVYTVTVSISDDDDGRDSQSFLVTVDNVDPSLAGVDGLSAVDEGAAFTLADLGVHLQDPGFDNPDNPLAADGSREILTALSVDWGDGSPVESIAAVDRVSGSAGVATIAQLSHAPHTYADNGIYEVTIRFHDDDGPRIDPAGGIVTESFFITVDNVAPTLFLTERALIVDEGSLLSIPDLGTFTDPAFNNPAGTPPTEETFTYEIDWGDGHVETAKAPRFVADGAPGIVTAGDMEDLHIYADNGEYTVTVTLRDDDGGFDVETIVIIVDNVAPTVLAFVGTDVSAAGETIVEASWDDPGFDNPLALPPTVESFSVMFDRGDGLVDVVRHSAQAVTRRRRRRCGRAGDFRRQPWHRVADGADRYDARCAAAGIPATTARIDRSVSSR